MSLTKWYWLIWLGICIPLNVDNLWNISIGFYDLKIPYAFHFILGLSFLFFLFRDPKSRALLKEYLFRPYVMALGLMLLAGLLGITNSENPRRAWMIWIWSAGTFLTPSLGGTAAL